MRIGLYFPTITPWKKCNVVHLRNPTALCTIPDSIGNEEVIEDEEHLWFS